MAGEDGTEPLPVPTEPVAEPAPEVRGAGQAPGAAAGHVCPFLAAIDLQDRVRPPSGSPDTANRCLSTGEPAAPSARDQAALCLSGEHVACPRYVHAARGARVEAPAPSGGPRISAPIAAAGVVLALAAFLAGVSLAAEGDLSVGLGAPSPSTPSASSAVGGEGESPGLSVTGASIVPATRIPASLTPTLPPTLASATPTPRPEPTPTPAPRKYPGLTACPGVADCYIYVVKRGDALGAVAARYGLSLDEVLARNPKIRDPGLIVLGQEIRIPTPRR